MRSHLALFLLFVSTISVRAQDLQAGVAKIDITPTAAMPLWGYGGRRDALSTGTNDPLHARALVFEVGKKRMALVSLDLGRAPGRESVSRIREEIRKKGNVETIFLVASHTHHAPVLEVESLPTAKTSYVRALEKKLAKVILDACKDLRPARLGIAGKETDFNRNRHSKRDDRPRDPLVQVMRVESLDGKVIAHAINFAAHPTMIPSKEMTFSADYPGVLCKTIEKNQGGISLFLQGASGDMSPNAGKHGRSPEEFGKALAKEVEGIIKTIRPTALEKPTLKSSEDELHFRCRADFKNPLLMTALRAAFFPALIASFEREYREGVRPHLTTAMLTDQIGFVGVSGEFFSAHALSLRKRARMPHLFFLGYCNDYHQYFPTIEAASEKGYGTETYIAPAEYGAGEKIMDRALLRLYQLRGKFTGEKIGE